MRTRAYFATAYRCSPQTRRTISLILGPVLSLLLLLPAQAAVLNLSWNAPTTNSDGTALADLSQYKVYFGPSSSPCPGTSVQSVPSLKAAPAAGDVITYSLAGLTTGSTYYVQVTAVDTGGNESGCSAQASGVAQASGGSDTTPPTGTLTINGGATATNNPAITVALSATDNVGVTGYYLSPSSTPPAATASGWVSLPGALSYSSSVAYTLASGDGSKTVYVWYKDAAGNVSTTASASIRLDQTAPSNGSLTATAGNTQVALSWAGVTDSGSGLASSPYKLLFASGTTPPATCTSGTQAYVGSATSYTHSGLSNGTAYSYRLCATDQAGNTSSGATASATPIAPPLTDTTPPTGTLTISGAAAATNNPAVTLALSATDNVGVTGYYLSTSSTPPAATASGWVTLPGALSYSSSVAYTLASGDGVKTVYAWYKDAAGNVSTPASASIRLDQTAPSNGTLTATASNTQVALSWAGVTDGGSGLATSPYKLVFSTGAAPAATCSSGTQAYAGSATSYTHSGLSNGTAYSYRLCATD
ncbi:MAG TPA: hypothetical protein VN203_04780, partial [Candidatus Acidoferrum sp.]|nr:hypothetical protein [Candidatus Acidoferrum sp.]